MPEQGETEFKRFGTIVEECTEQDTNTEHSGPRRSSVDHSVETERIVNTTTKDVRRSSADTSSRRSSIDVSVDTHQAVEEGRPGWSMDSTPCPVSQVASAKRPTMKRRSDSDIPRQSGNGDRMPSSARSQSARSMRAETNPKSKSKKKSSSGEGLSHGKQPSTSSLRSTSSSNPKSKSKKTSSSGEGLSYGKQPSTSSLRSTSSSKTSKSGRESKTPKPSLAQALSAAKPPSQLCMTPIKPSIIDILPKQKSRVNSGRNGTEVGPRRKSDRSVGTVETNASKRMSDLRRKSDRTIATELMTHDCDEESCVGVSKRRCSFRSSSVPCLSTKRRRKICRYLSILILGITTGIIAALIFQKGNESAPMKALRGIGNYFFSVEDDSITHSNGLGEMMDNAPISTNPENGNSVANVANNAPYSSSPLVPKVDKISHFDENELNGETSVSMLGLRGNNGH